VFGRAFSATRTHAAKPTRVLLTAFGRFAAFFDEFLRILSVEMLNDAMDNLQITLFEGTDSVINFALPKKFNEHLSLPWPIRRIWEEL
jgi:hypothetical protein